MTVTTTLHNFVRKSNIHDPDFDLDWREDDDQQPPLNDDARRIVEEVVTVIVVTIYTGSRQYTKWLHHIAMDVWNTHG